MNTPRLIPFTLTALLLGLAACGTPEADDDPTGDPECGAEGVRVERDAQGYCVYRAQAITETGFSCPAGAPHRYDNGDAIVCGPSPDLPSDIIEEVSEQARPEWNIEDNNTPSPNNPNNTDAANNPVSNNTSAGNNTSANNTSANNTSTGNNTATSNNTTRRQQRLGM